MGGDFILLHFWDIPNNWKFSIFSQDLLEFAVSHRIAPEMSEDHVSSALLPCVISAATTSGTRLSLATKQSQALVAVTEADGLSKLTVASASTTDSNIKVVELALRPLQAEARPKTQDLNMRKTTVLAERVAKAEAKQKKGSSGRKNRCCYWCRISRNSGQFFNDYNQSGKHRHAVQNLTLDLNYFVWKLKCHLAADLSTHKLSSARTKAAQQGREKSNKVRFELGDKQYLKFYRICWPYSEKYKIIRKLRQRKK